MRARGNPSIQKIMFAHIALLGFQRAGGLSRRFSSRPLLYTALRLLQVIMTYFPINFFAKGFIGHRLMAMTACREKMLTT